MIKTYLITLTPTGKFFFGGDMTFEVKSKDPNKEKEDEKFNSKFSSYIIRSNKLPQQTSLLGMLRFLILRNDDNVFNVKEQQIIDKNRTKASELIGTESFRIGKTDGYGKIKKIFPCFIQKDGVPIRLLERDYKFKIQFKGSKGHTNKKDLFDLPEIIGYNAKDGIPSLYLIDKVEVPESDIFVKDVSNGINRDITTGKVDENAYFKQICYRFNDKLYEYEKPEYDNKREYKKKPDGKVSYSPCKYSFAFYAEVDYDKLNEYNGQIVSVGGDNSQFIIGIKETCAPTEPKADGTNVVLASPAYLTTDDLVDIRFAICDTIPFKCIKTETQTVEAYNRCNNRYEYIEGLTLYDRGSVFYFNTPKEAEAFIRKLIGHADFYQIGYNHYQVK